MSSTSVFTEKLTQDLRLWCPLQLKPQCRTFRTACQHTNWMTEWNSRIKINEVNCHRSEAMLQYPTNYPKTQSCAWSINQWTFLPHMICQGLHAGPSFAIFVCALTIHIWQKCSLICRTYTRSCTRMANSRSPHHQRHPYSIKKCEAKLRKMSRTSLFILPSTSFYKYLVACKLWEGKLAEEAKVIEQWQKETDKLHMTNVTVNTFYTWQHNDKIASL